MRKQAFLAFLLLVVASFANAAQSVDIYVGDSGGEPANWKGPTYECWTPGDQDYVDRIAAGFCVKHTSTGKVQGDFRWQVKSSRLGGRCGFNIYTVECL